MKKMVRALSLMLALILVMSMLITPVGAGTAEATTRTVMMYCVGSDLESRAGLATDNMIKAMESDYNVNLSFIVITGGTYY